MEFRRRRLRIWTAAVILALATSAVSVLQLAYSRQRHMDSGAELAKVLSNAAAQRIVVSMQLLDQLLTETVERFPTDTPVPDGILEPLRAKLSATKDIRAMAYVDADGVMRQVVHRQTTIQSLPVDVADRAHYQFQRRHWMERKLALSPPALDRLTDVMAWYASRSIVSADGRFLGQIGMALEPELLAAPLRAATPGDGDAAGVFSLDGVLFSRHPYVPQAIGHSIAGTLVFKAFSEAGENGSGSLPESVGTSDGIMRVVGFTRVPGYPLVVSVGISHERLFKQWWREVHIHGGIQAALIAGIFLLAWGLIRAERRHLAATEKLRMAERDHIESLSREVQARTGELEHSLAALQESEERFRLISDISPLPLVVTRRTDGIVIYINAQAAKAFQVPQEEAFGKVAPNFWENPADRSRMVETLVRDGTVRNLEAVLKRADGERFTALLSAAFGHFKGDAMVLVSVWDISERKRLEDELARSNAELERFSYAISHDLQEPLRMVASYVGLIERRYGQGLDSEGKEFISYAVDGAKRMSRMISDLLEFSRVRRQKWHFKPTDLNAVTADALANLNSVIEASQALIEVNELPTLPADPGQIMRVVQNLIGNALKYREPDRPPEIHMQCRIEGNHCIIEIVDNGRGFDPSETARLFQVFQRLHPNCGVDGSGVGLALCRSIIAAHGGTIWGHSEGRGRGARFGFSLPLERDDK